MPRPVRRQEDGEIPACRQAGVDAMYYLYVLQSINTGFFYKGITQDLDRRLKEHERGQCQTTKHLRPFRLVHVETCQTKNRAIKLERYFKSGFGREIIHELAEVAKLVDALP